MFSVCVLCTAWHNALCNAAWHLHSWPGPITRTLHDRQPRENCGTVALCLQIFFHLPSMFHFEYKMSVQQCVDHSSRRCCADTRQDWSRGEEAGDDLSCWDKLFIGLVWQVIITKWTDKDAGKMGARENWIRLGYKMYFLFGWEISLCFEMYT